MSVGASGRPSVELRSQATYDRTYRDRFSDMDASIRDRLETVIDRGIEDGVIREVGPERTAESLLTVMLGGLFRRATAEDVDVEAVRVELETFVRAHLLVEE